MNREYVYRDQAIIERFNQPTLHDVHIDQPMSQVSIAYRNENYIADQVFPFVKVQKQSDKYFIFGKSAWFRNEAGPRALGTRAPRVDYTLTTPGLYQCIEYAAAKGVPDEIVLNADNPLNPDREATEFVTEKILMRLEKNVADTVFTSGNWTNSGAPQNGAWSLDTSDPIADVVGKTGSTLGVRETVRQTIGRYPNVAVLGAQVWAVLQRHPDILDRVKYTQLGIVTEGLVAQLFQVKKLLIGTAVIDSAAEGAATSFGDIWGNFAWFGWVPPSVGLMIPAAGYILAWKERQVARYREEQEHQDVVEALMNWSVKITSADSGYLVTSAA